jgi:hypothetical protein
VEQAIRFFAYHHKNVKIFRLQMETALMSYLKHASIKGKLRAFVVFQYKQLVVIQRFVKISLLRQVHVYLLAAIIWIQVVLAEQ